MNTAKALILIVEDDKPTVELLRVGLAAEDYAICVAKSLDEARVRVAELSPDLVVLDRNLQDADGLNLCTELRATRTRASSKDLATQMA